MVDLEVSRMEVPRRWLTKILIASLSWQTGRSRLLDIFRLASVPVNGFDFWSSWMVLVMVLGTTERLGKVVGRLSTKSENE